MGRVSDLMIEMETLAASGVSAADIAADLGVPLSWAEYAIEQVECEMPLDVIELTYELEE